MKTIVCGVHGVLLDVITPLCESIGFNKAKWPKGEYNLYKATGEHSVKALSDIHFWEGLGKTTHGFRYYNILRSYCDRTKTNLIFCSVAHSATIAAGTIYAFNREYGRDNNLMIVNNLKCRFFKPDDLRTLLIDDCDTECENWLGYTYLVPALWNKSDTGISPIDGLTDDLDNFKALRDE